MTSFLDFWGSGNVRMRRLTPSTRIACGLFVLASCLIAPMHKSCGISIACGTVIAWVLLCAMPRKSMAGLLFYSFLIFAPFFLLTPWIETHSSASNNWLGAARVPLEIGLLGIMCIFVCASTIASLDLTEFNSGLSRLPIPRAMASIIVQIVHQTAMLTNESQRISSAVRIRGAPSGAIAKLRFLSGLPTIWLLRIMNRAERIAAAMDLRGFEGTTRTSKASLSSLDAFAMTIAVLLLGATITIRWLDVL